MGSVMFSVIRALHSIDLNFSKREVGQLKLAMSIIYSNFI